MGGGYIECGKFKGNDKSGSALFGVFEAIQSMLPASEQNKWESDFLAGIEATEDEQERESKGGNNCPGRSVSEAD